MTDLRSILLHVDDSKRIGLRVQFARRLAEAFDAKVDAQYAVTPLLMRYPLALQGTAETISLVVQADEDARLAAKAAVVSARAGDARLTWSERSCDVGRFAARSLYGDLIVVGQRDPDDSSGELPGDFVQNLIIDSGKPVLVVPHVGNHSPLPDRVMVAWKETREAARAVSAALPWLRRARHVTVACYDADASACVDRLAAWLASHGVTEVVRDLAPSAAAEAGELLLSRAADTDAELLVMGCYGHSRSREWALGGASRAILRSMTRPVLMAH